MGGFTLVELLIVIALISILSVAVLATINPIEQANKAKDSTVQNDAAEVMNAYERMYANSNSYPWMLHADVKTVDADLIVRSDAVGFGICGLGAGITGVTFDAAGICPTATTTTLGTLVEKDELKAAFAGKGEFSTPGVNFENSLYTYKAGGSGGSIYVCYVPKAKSNRQQSTKLYCLYQNGAAVDRCKVGTSCTGVASPCVAKLTTANDWDQPVLNGTSGMFMCVPE